MKTLIVISATILALIYSSFNNEKKIEVIDNDIPNQNLSSSIPFNDAPDNLPSLKKQDEEEGPELERLYFEAWHYPNGSILEEQYLQNVWSQINATPSENDFDNGVTETWRQIGPYGSDHVTTTGRFSGRVLDIEVGNTANPLIASASGALWSYVGFLPYSLSDNINSLVCGTVATNPSNANTILLGTGEPSVRTGTGLWRSTNSGSTWTNISINPSPGRFYRIRYQSSTVVHAVTTAGYYRSTNNGLNWTQYMSGNISDIAINKNNTNIIYAGKWGDGVFKTTNNGLNWSKVTTSGIPTSGTGRIAVTIGTSNSNKVYASIANSDGSMMGVYMSSNDGATWSDVSPPENFMGDQGWYDNVIGVCPTNSTIVIVGGVRLWRSTNSGTSWTEVVDDNVHADQHSITWTEDGTDVYIGNDGGVTVSTNQGVSFSTQINYFPITQYVNFDVGVSNRGVIFGGSQDNGFTGTTNGGSTWIFTKGGDGGGVAVDPHSALYIYGTAGAYNGAYKFRRYKSTDKGITWDTNNTGVDPASSWYTKMRSDRVFPINLFTNSGNYVYKSIDDGETWSKLNPVLFPVSVANLNVSKNVGAGAVVYATLGSSTSGQRLRVYDGGSFFERSSGLPTGLTIRGVATHITNRDVAYALMNGTSDGEKVYKTTNRGTNWTNISGNLPNVPIGDLVPHPTNNNNLYLGSEMGCYRTTNAGVSWHRWNNGMPEATIVTEMKWIDSTLDNGKFYIVAGTYGRSLWVRDISGDDPGNTLNITTLVQGFYNPNTNLSVRDTVRIYLRESSSPYQIVDSAKSYFSNTGTATLTFPYAFNATSYYIQLKHRNSIETWSSTANDFEDYALSYDFSYPLTKAYGNNMIYVDITPIECAIFGGDVNQDDIIDAADVVLVYNASTNFLSGYISTDVTGDNFADVSDLILTYNNSVEFIEAITP